MASSCSRVAMLCALWSSACGPRAVTPRVVDSDGNQPSLTAIVDGAGSLWVAAGFTNHTRAEVSEMGLTIRAPSGNWQTYPSLLANGFRPSGDGWLAATQGGRRAYYVSLLQYGMRDPTNDETGDGLALAVIDVAAGTPSIGPPQRVDLGTWPAWDEPSIAATRSPGASDDTVIVAANPIGPNYQDLVALLVSHDSGRTFHDVAALQAPGARARVYGRPDNTLVRPFLQQDPRPGRECHVYIAYGVYYPTALRDTIAVAVPACLSEPDGCRAIAESESLDCGETWSEPVFAAIDTGPTGGLDFRGFGYAVANDGQRYVVYTDEDSANAPILLKRAAPDQPFVVTRNVNRVLTWDDGPLETLVSGPSASGAPVSRWRPSLAASDAVAVTWIEETTDTHQATVRFCLSDGPGWRAPDLVDPAASGVICDTAAPDDDYLGVTPAAVFGAAAREFYVGWTNFLPCGSTDPHHIQVSNIR